MKVQEINNMAKRNYGIDLIRIVSMFFVLLLHNLLQGGILTDPKLTGSSWYVAWTVEAIAIVAVNLFAMITGYLSVGHGLNTKRIITIVLQTLFWAWVVTIVLILLGYDFSMKQLALSFVPINGFWYVKAYIGMMLLTPLIDVGISKISKILFERILICALLICVSVGWMKQFFLLDGYSSYWLIMMYLVGVYINKFNGFAQIKSYIFVILYTLSLMGTIFLEKVLSLLGIGLGRGISYISPFVVVQSIAFFCLLMRISIKNTIIQKILIFFAPVSFGVYLIDTSSFYNVVLKGSFAIVVKNNSMTLFLVIVFVSTLMYIAFSLLDYVRLLLFKTHFFVRFIENVDKLTKKLVDVARSFILKS